MAVEIHGSRRTIAARYEAHAEQKRQEALANMPPPGGSIFMMPGCHHHYGCNMGMYGMNTYGFGPPPDCGTQNWFTSFFAGNVLGQGITNFFTNIFGHKQA